MHQVRSHQMISKGLVYIPHTADRGASRKITRPTCTHARIWLPPPGPPESAAVRGATAAGVMKRGGLGGGCYLVIFSCRDRPSRMQNCNCCIRVIPPVTSQKAYLLVISPFEISSCCPRLIMRLPGAVLWLASGLALSWTGLAGAETCEDMYNCNFFVEQDQTLYKFDLSPLCSEQGYAFKDTINTVRLQGAAHSLRAVHGPCSLPVLALTDLDLVCTSAHNAAGFE